MYKDSIKTPQQTTFDYIEIEKGQMVLRPSKLGFDPIEDSPLIMGDIEFLRMIKFDHVGTERMVNDYGENSDSKFLFVISEGDSDPRSCSHYEPYTTTLNPRMLKNFLTAADLICGMLAVDDNSKIYKRQAPSTGVARKRVYLTSFVEFHPSDNMFMRNDLLDTLTIIDFKRKLRISILKLKLAKMPEYLPNHIRIRQFVQIRCQEIPLLRNHFMWNDESVKDQYKTLERVGVMYVPVTDGGGDRNTPTPDIESDTATITRTIDTQSTSSFQPHPNNLAWARPSAPSMISSRLSLNSSSWVQRMFGGNQ